MKLRALDVVPLEPANAPDTVALRRISSGDLGALGELYDRHAAALLQFATRAVGPADAEDLVQALFVRVAKIAGTYDGRTDDARSWLYGVLARLMRERRRSLSRYTRAVFRLAHHAARGAGRSDDDRSDLAKGLQQLSQAKRLVVVLAEVEGYTCDEIATILAIPTGTVWTRLHHARKELRSFYQRGSP